MILYTFNLNTYLTNSAISYSFYFTWSISQPLFLGTSSKLMKWSSFKVLGSTVSSLMSSLKILKDTNHMTLKELSIFYDLWYLTREGAWVRSILSFFGHLNPSVNFGLYNRLVLKSTSPGPRGKLNYLTS